MLLHHLVGNSVSENLKKFEIDVWKEINKFLMKDGQLIIVRSCVPNWFYKIEKILYKPTSYFIKKFMKHPPAFQFARNVLV